MTSAGHVGDRKFGILMNRRRARQRLHGTGGGGEVCGGGGGGQTKFMI